MCGIVGYIGEENATDVLVDGLKKLEYRGYDSAGIAVFDHDQVKVVKTKGRLADMEKKMEQEGKPSGFCGIGHTRWATHGEPSDVNSHPHESNRVILVHNGIIENYLQIKEFLVAHGYSFVSQTDTETVAKLIDYYYKGDPFTAITQAIGRIRGSYALGILFKDRPDTLYAVRKDSPLIVGVGQGENFIASDIPAILKHTRNYYLLDENEIVELTKDTVKIYDLDHHLLQKEMLTANWDIEAAEKGGYPHFMLKEIHEQPKALRDTLSPRIQNHLPDCQLENLSEDFIKRIGRIHIVACGTAMYAGMVGKVLLEKLAKIPVEVDVASEFRYRDPLLSTDDLVLIISQSGETADTLAALRLAKKAGVKTLAIVNVVGSSIAREADSVLYTWAGPEIAVASTKAYSVQVAMLYLLAFQFALLRKELSTAQVKELTSQLETIPDLVDQVIHQQEHIQYLASQFQNTKDLFFLGRGLDYALAMEGSLKLKEISYIHSEAYAAGELKHGTISLIVEGTPVIALMTQDYVFEKMLSNVKEVKARGARVLTVCKEENDVQDVSDYAIVLPKMPDLFMPLVTISSLQLFAYYTAVLRGCDVDKPRNLAKSVTVE